MGISDAAAGLHLVSQWRNPSDVTPILMVIGGDVVQKALAAGSGVWWITPVCFSFGWVSYSFIALMNLIGNGCLMPKPDFSMKLINLDNGCVRQNSNWSLGRLTRDLISSHNQNKHHSKPTAGSTHTSTEGLADPEAGSLLSKVAVRIKVYEASVDKNWKHSLRLPITQMYVVSLACILIQLSLAAIPLGMAGEWDIVMMTCTGTLLAQLAGCLPQWRVEKLPNPRKKSKVVALTAGNGSEDIIVVKCDKTCWDIEAFASLTQPRFERDWISDKKGQKRLKKT